MRILSFLLTLLFSTGAFAANSDQYFKAPTATDLQLAFFTQNDDGTYSPDAGLNIAPITQAHAAIASYVDANGNTIPASPQTGDGVSYYVNIRADVILSVPSTITAVTGTEGIPVTGMWN